VAVASLQALIERIALASSDAEIAAARADFVGRTGTFEPDEPFYEERVRAAFDDAVTAFGAPRAAMLRRWLVQHDEPRTRALLRTWRTLLQVEKVSEHAQVRVLLTDAEFLLVRDDGPAGKLREGDLFDGRLFVHEGVRLLPGPVFFERDAHQAIGEVLAEARRHERGSEASCDALLRMQMRRLRQPGLRVHHVYRWDAFDRTEMLAAPWVRPR